MKAASSSSFSKPPTASSIGRLNGSSNFRTVVNFALVAIGVGILALPRAIAQGGWIVGSLLLLIAWAVSQYAIFLLWKCMVMPPDGNEKFTSFQAIGRECFGRVGIMMPLAWMPTMKEVAFVSGLGIAAALVTVIMIIVASSREAVDPVSHHDYDLVPSTPMYATLSFTNFMNAFTVAPVVPTLINDMRSPMRFPRVSVIGFLLVFIIFASIAFAGYAGFGVGSSARVANTRQGKQVPVSGGKRPNEVEVPKGGSDRLAGQNLLGQAQAEFDRLVSECGKLRKHLAANQQASESQRTTIGELEAKLNESQAEMDGLKREASDREAELRESLSAAKSKINDLQMMNKRMKEELAAVREESESRRQTCDQLGEQIAKLQADSKTSVAEVASLREHVRSIFCSVDYHAHRGIGKGFTASRSDRVRCGNQIAAALQQEAVRLRYRKGTQTRKKIT
ncbi:amino acid transporter, putative [Perkinsus marinus ATCC 50983]|uniref:Amino acid transporter, putative n=1 Tax=Perkinsus marinus (strain ATCC 50983 / TXsc) TaxID=423536 RepID=C5M0R4_PERM5|nr:amino acid transporter, putative [Perkinsus marinus ATCC 50983]EEQ97422.1 amino acid transporter, putative [Perkinsus marinus ATCC 50983]|eukprot:XP_002764705.1 amino acid transporter, putative [Perkinsus marinus ATCC 50983]